MQISKRELRQRYDAVSDAVARLDLDQEDRELVARSLGDALDGAPEFRRDTFVLLASDPLVPCAGWDDDGVHHDCEHGRVIRIAMHLSSAPDGRSFAWKRRAPYGQIRCVSCGSLQFMPGYRERVLGRSAV